MYSSLPYSLINPTVLRSDIELSNIWVVDNLPIIWNHVDSSGFTRKENVACDLENRFRWLLFIRVNCFIDPFLPLQPMTSFTLC